MINWLQNHLFVCSFKSTFGINCPGCGMQRAFIELLKGNLYESLSYHIALTPFLITIILLIIQLIKRFNNGGTWVMWAFIVTSGLTFVQYVVKQIMYFS